MGGWTPSWIRIPLVGALSNQRPRRSFIPARLASGGIEAVASHGSGDLIAAGAADALISLPAGTSCLAGDQVEVLPYLGGWGDAPRLAR